MFHLEYREGMKWIKLLDPTNGKPRLFRNEQEALNHGRLYFAVKKELRTKKVEEAKNA